MSGITQFDTGAIRDSQEGKEDYIEGNSWLAEKRFAKYMDGKAAKYGRGNWKKGIPPDQALRSLARHFQKFVSEWEYGICEEHDDHLAAMRFNLNLLMHELELIRLGRGRFKASKEYAGLYEEYAPDTNATKERLKEITGLLSKAYGDSFPNMPELPSFIDNSELQKDQENEKEA